jgi:hypothetical protein
MSRVKSFNEFLNEKYEENPDYRIKQFFVELEKNIRNWFTEGTLGANGAELGKIERSLANAIDKNLIFEFSDTEFFYQVYVIVSLQEVGEEILDECFVKVKKYDIESMSLLRTLGEDVKCSDLNEDKILELFAKLDEEGGEVKEDEEGELEVDEEDTDLEDTSLA